MFIRGLSVLELEIYDDLMVANVLDLLVDDSMGAK
jgi:hypothetical protein